MIMIRENPKELYALYGFFRVFEECGKPPTKIDDAYIDKILKCKSRLTAIDAYNNGLELSVYNSVTDTCPCDYVVDVGQWDIIIKSVKKYQGKKESDKFKELKNSCIENIESICPEGLHHTLKTVEIGADKN